MEIGEKIKKLRLEQGLTLEQLGNMCGVGKSTVRKWETGQIHNMRRDKIALLADALHVSPTEFIEPEPPKKKNIIRVYHSQNIFDETGRVRFPRPKPRPQEEILLMDNFSKLNAEGKKKVLEYMSDLLEMDKYKKTDPDGGSGPV